MANFEKGIVIYFTLLVVLYLGAYQLGLGGNFEVIIVCLVIAIILGTLAMKVAQRLREKMLSGSGLSLLSLAHYGAGLGYMDVQEIEQEAYASLQDEEILALPAAQEVPIYQPVQKSHAVLNDSLSFSQHFSHPLEDFLNQNVLFIGDRRSGKSNGLGRLAEQESAFLVPMVVFDTQGDYTSLAHPLYFPRGVLVGSHRMAQEYKRLHVHALDAKSAFSFGRTVVAEGLQAVIDLRYYQQPGIFPDEEAAQVMVNVINGIDSWEREQESHDRVSCSIYLDEAHLWVPQQAGDTTMKMNPDTYNALQAALFSTIVRMGGKMGFGLRLATQRIVEIDKRALQSYWTFIYRQSLQNDLDRIRQYGIPAEEVRELKKGECFILGPEIRVKVHMSERRSPHGGDSPTMENLFQHQRRNQVHSVASVLSHVPHSEQSYLTSHSVIHPAVAQQQPVQKSIIPIPPYEYIPFAARGEETSSIPEAAVIPMSEEQIQLAARYWNDGAANSVRSLQRVMPYLQYEQARAIRGILRERRLIADPNDAIYKVTSQG